MVVVREKFTRRYPMLASLVDWFADSRLSHILGEWEWFASRSPFIRESRRDPGGHYALDLVYRCSPAGVSVLDRFTDWYYLNCTLATASRARLRAVAAWLRHRARVLLRANGRARVLSLACGGARDAVLAFAHMPGRENVDFLGVDCDEDAVAFATRLADDAGLSHFRYERADVLDLDTRWKDDFDLVTAIGLFHYLDVGVIRKTLRWIHDILPEGGRLLFDVAVRNPSRRFFEEKLGWYIRCLPLDEILALGSEAFPGSTRLCHVCKNCFQVIECTKQPVSDTP